MTVRSERCRVEEGCGEREEERWVVVGEGGGRAGREDKLPVQQPCMRHQRWCLTHRNSVGILFPDALRLGLALLCRGRGAEVSARDPTMEGQAPWPHSPRGCSCLKLLGLKDMLSKNLVRAMRCVVAKDNKDPELKRKLKPEPPKPRQAGQRPRFLMMGKCK